MTSLTCREAEEAVSKSPAMIAVKGLTVVQTLAGRHGSMQITQQPPGTQGSSLRCRQNRAARVAVCRSRCRASAARADATTRRDLLLAGSVLGPSLWLPQSPALAEIDMNTNSTSITVNGLSAFQRSAQKSQIANRAQKELLKVLTPQDGPTSLRTLLLDAATYDVATGQGGVNGSIRLSAELGRPEAKGLKPYIDKLAKAKQAIDELGAASGQGPISWADLICLAVKVTAAETWSAIKVKRASIPSGGDTISKAFGAAFPLPLGRRDVSEPDPEVKNFPSNDASPQEIRDFFYKLGNKKPEGGGFISGKPPFWDRVAYILWTNSQPDQVAAEEKLGQSPLFAGWKKQYDRSKDTVTRTEFEVDFIDFFNRLAQLGAKYDQDAYLYPITIQVPKLR